MCGRYTQTYETVKLKPRFDLTEIRGEFRPRYNVSPGQDVPVVLQVDAGRVLDHFRWGLVPVWTKALKGAPKPINAKSETVASSAMFKRLLTSRRCLVPADSFYEWQGEKGRKRPMRIQLKSGELFAFAGLWDSWRDPALGDQAPTLRTCTVLTTSPNPLVARVHNRMPVILPVEAEAIWLDRSVKDPMKLLPLLRPFPAEEMMVVPVSSAVNNSRFDGPECIRPEAEPITLAS